MVLEPIFTSEIDFLIIIIMKLCIRSELKVAEMATFENGEVAMPCFGSRSHATGEFAEGREDDAVGPNPKSFHAVPGGAE